MSRRATFALSAALLCACAKGGPFAKTTSAEEYMAEARRRGDEHERAKREQLAMRPAPEPSMEPPDPQPQPSPAPKPEARPGSEVTRAAEPITAAEAVEALDEHGAYMRAQAKKHGFKDILLGESLTSVLNEVVEEAYDTKKIRPFAIGLGGYDGEFVAEQVLDGGRVRFASDYSTAQFVLQGYRGPVYEGTSLFKLKIEAVRIVGVKSFPTAIGGSVQAFVVEPAWQ